MKRHWHTLEQTIRKLRTAKQMLSEGKTAKALEVSEQTRADSVRCTSRLFRFTTEFLKPRQPTPLVD